MEEVFFIFPAFLKEVLMKEKKLTRVDILSLVIGSIIGWGSFTLPGKQFLSESGVINTAIGLFLGAFLIMFIQKSYHIMLTKHKNHGGEFTYVLNNLGKKHGLIVALCLSLCYLSMIPLNANAYVLLINVIFGKSMSFGYMYSIGGSPVYFSDVLITAIVIIIFAVINIKGLKTSSKIQNVMSFLLVIIVFTTLALVFIKSDKQEFYRNYIHYNKISAKEIMTVVAIVPFLFVGFDVIPQVSTELKFKPHKATVLAVSSVFIGALIYASLNLIAGLSFSPDESIKTSWAVADSILMKLGYTGFGFMLIALWAAITGGINAFMIASSKLVASISMKGFIPEVFGKENENNAFPFSIALVSALSIVTPFFGRQVILYIVDISSLLAAIAYGYVGLVSFRLSDSVIDKIYNIVSMLISTLFIILLVYPDSPASIKTPSYVILAIWISIAIVVYGMGNFIQNRKGGEAIQTEG